MQGQPKQQYPRYTVQECDRILTAPGEILEIQEVVLHGKKQRVWKNLPPTFRAFLLACFEKYSGRVFLSYPSGTSADQRTHLTFDQLLENAYRLAGWMRDQGLGLGSKVAIGGPNCPEWITTFVATQLIGGITACLNIWLPLEQLAHCLVKTKPDLILVDGETYDKLGPIFTSLNSNGVGPTVSWHSKIFSTGLANVPQEEISAVRSGEDLVGLGPESDAVIFFSSGTSGPPKAVLSTQRMALANIFSGMVAPARACLRAGLPVPPLPTAKDPQKIVLLAIPLFHVTGCLSWLLRGFYGGSKLVMLRKWDARDAVRAIESEGVTVIGGVPAVVTALLNSPDLPKSRAFDSVFYGGAPPSKQLADEVKARWPKAGLVQGYGLTETNAYLCSIYGPDYMHRPESTGPPVPISKLKIVDPDTRAALPTGQVGLILVYGPQVMKCYMNDEAATRSAIDSDGWFDSGDMGYVDDEGFLFIKDRLKDIIIRGGENIPSMDVENALCAAPSVAEAAVISVPDPLLGELVGAIVALRPGQSATEEAIMEHVKPLLGTRAWPSIILVQKEPIPRNPNGKVVKKDLRPLLVKAWAAKQKSQPVRAKL